MKKTDYIAIAKGLAAYDFENKCSSHLALNDIFAALHKSDDEQNTHYPRFLEMRDAYDKEMARFADADKTSIQKAMEQIQKEIAEGNS